MNSSAQKTGDTCTVNCRFNHSILSLHLCKEYLAAVKLRTLFLLQIKYWTFWCMDCSASIKSNMLENSWSGRNMWTMNNGWIAILVKYGFITLLQRIFNCTKMQHISIISDKALSTLVYGSPFCVIIYTSYRLSNTVRFFMGKINWHLRCSIVYPNVRKEYLNMVTLRITVLLPIKSWTFRILNAFLPHHIQESFTFKNGPVFIGPPWMTVSPKRPLFIFQI